ncbi:putative hscarg dehydrogenase [Cadophora sp. DSE1049]|nr:putative hscarg dehydrogenase [Cadophora sp. DSE1049]
MAPILTIVGATGVQGGSVLEAALKSGLYNIRAITRNTASAKAKDLQARGVEIVSADLDSEESLIKAFEGSTAIFGLTNFFEHFPRLSPDAAIALEVKQGQNLANAAAKTPTLKHYIWSTLPDAEKISKGQISVPHHQGKAQIDTFIKANEELYAKTTFLWVGAYAQNFEYPWTRPNLFKTSGKYIQLGPVSPTTPVQTIGDVTTNVGIFTTAILAQRAITQRKYVLATAEDTTVGGLVKSWGDATGKDTLYIEIASIDEYDKVWPVWGREIGLMMKFWESAGENCWSGEDMLVKEDLGLSGDMFVASKETFEKMSWN